jgi:hypothetical protein
MCLHYSYHAKRDKQKNKKDFLHSSALVQGCSQSCRHPDPALLQRRSQLRSQPFSLSPAALLAAQPAQESWPPMLRLTQSLSRSSAAALFRSSAVALSPDRQSLLSLPLAGRRSLSGLSSLLFALSQSLSAICKSCSKKF